MSADGTELWRFRTKDKILSSPALSPAGTIYVGSKDNYVYALTSEGRERWRFD
ncbi:MAG: outer membrane protein assembly factor BamB family protein, partial [Planctomycetota bacterium]